MILSPPALLPSLVATAQDGDITPDTLAWRDYFPLQLGNRWQYENVSEHDFGMSDRWIEDWYLSGDTVIAAATYFVMSVRCDSLYSNPGFGTNPCVRHDGNRRLVRYDTTSNNVAERVVDRNGGFVESGFFGYNFDLAGDFGFSNEMFAYSQDDASPVLIATDTLRARVKRISVYSGVPGEFWFVNGVGMVSSGFHEAGGTSSLLTYARVGDDEIGNRSGLLGTNDDRLPGALRVSVFPNPAVGEFKVSWTPTRYGTATVFVTDVLGRQTSKHRIQALAGRPTIATVNATDLARGVYFVAVAIDGRVEAVESLVVTN